MRVETASPSSERMKEYAKSQRVLRTLLALLLFVPWIPDLLYGQTNLVAAILSSLVIASAFLVLYSYFQARIERKYRQVSATQRDYFVSNLPLYFVSLVPGLLALGFSYMIPRFGLFTVVYVDAILTVIFLVFARFPPALRVGQRATPITDEHLLVSFRELARKMGVENVNLYSVDWAKFKVANAFQVGPRKFSVYVSNYLLEKMSAGEMNAVMAHELAHAKEKHVAKSLALFLFPLTASMNLLIVGATFVQDNLVLGVVLFLVGFGLIIVVPRVALRFQRGFELDADAVAAQTIDDPRAMISALRKMAELNLIPAGKGSLTHPSITKRVQRIEQLAKIP